MAVKNKFYVVWRGRETGIFEGWDKCKEQIEGYPGAQYKGYPDWEKAHEAHQHSYWHETAIKKVMAAETEVERRSVCVEAECDAEGRFSYWGYETDTGKMLFHSPEYQDGNMNVAQFLALVHAVALLKKMDNDTRAVYCCNDTAISWVRKSNCNTNLCRTLNNTAVFDLLIRANRYLAENSVPNSILKWNTDSWGKMKREETNL